MLALPAAPAQAAAAKTPSKIVSMTATPGPGVGEVTFRWKTEGKNTTGYKIQTALTMFNPKGKGLPKKGRHSKTFSISGKKRSFTLTASQAAAAGAKAGSGNHLYFRFYAVNTKGTGTAVRSFAGLRAAMPKAPNVGGGTRVRLAAFNVRTAKATGDRRGWMQRRTDVARSIVRTSPQVVALQELGPGRADGKHGSTLGTLRQTDSLTRSLASVGGGRYKLVRTTPYVAPGKPTGTQGARILYDTSKLSLLSICSDKTKGRNYSSSCTIKLPLLKGDKEGERRRAAYAKFRNKQTGKQFYVVSAHLDMRHSKNTRAERKYNALRGQQAAVIASTIAKLNKQNLPVVVAGDLNSWQNNQVGNAPHDVLVARGFFDTAAAVSKVNLHYPTINHFDTRLRPATVGFAPRLDAIMVKGARGAYRFENVVKAIDSARPSDHNLIVADTAI
jgi:endonuclease/exonuclease/phosphatase family metal-dependent hydrolase